MESILKTRIMRVAVAAAVLVAMVFASAFTLKDNNVYAAAEGTMISNAVNVQFGKQYSKYWTKDTDHLNHYCKITVPSSGIVCINATKPNDSEGEYGRMIFTLYDSSGNVIWGNKVYKAVDGILDTYQLYVGLNKGTYYMTVKPGFTVTAGLIETDYKLTFTSNAYCEKESNEGISDATSVTLGKIYTGYIGNDGYYDTEENDYYKFKLTKGKNYKIAVGSYSKLEPTTALFKLIDPNGNDDRISNKLESKIDSNGMNYYIYTAPTTGTYYFDFYNYSGAQIKYTFRVSEFTKKTQKISTRATSYTKKTSSDNFFLKASAKGKLKYSSSNKDVCSVYSDGEVYINGVGKAIITIKAAATEEYKAATKKVTVTVKPKNIQLKSVKNLKPKKIKATWKCQYDIDGYQLQLASNSKFTKNKNTFKLRKYYDDEITISKMKKGNYWVRLRTYVKADDGKTYYSDWSKVKKIKVSK